MTASHYWICLIFVARILGDETPDPLGHGQVLGKHRPAEGHVPVLTELPTAQEFWEKYVSIRRPVVFRAPGKLFPAYKKWTDDYLIENFGELEVKLEHKTEKGKTPVGERGVGRDTIKSFLETYKTKSSYIVSQMPDPMAQDILVPPFMMCGTIYDRLLESNLWLSAGGTKSLLHRDADHAINCLLNGTKDWILIDPKQEKNIPIAKGDSGYGGFAVLDVDKVNLLKYPKFKEVKWEYANMTPGDCLYLPCGYWHQVRSYGEKNVAATVLFSRIKSFNGSDCEIKKANYTPLSDTGMVWTYPGYGPQTLGNLDPFELRENLAKSFKDRRKAKMTYKDLKEHYNGAEDVNKKNGEADALGNHLIKIFDLENKGYITKEDIQSASVDQLKEAANAIDPDPANTDTYEHFMFEPVHAKRLIQRAMDKESNSLTLDSLTKVWMKGGGSKKIANDLFNLFKHNEDTLEVSREDVERKLPKALKLFEKRRKDDPSGSYYQKQLKEDKAQFGEKLAEDDEEEPGDDDDTGEDDKEPGDQSEDEEPEDQSENEEPGDQSENEEPGDQSDVAPDDEEGEENKESSAEQNGQTDTDGSNGGANEKKHDEL